MNQSTTKRNTPRSYAVSAGDRLSDSWLLHHRTDGQFHLRVHGPNGFFREFRGSSDSPLLKVQFDSTRKLSGDVKPALIIYLTNHERKRSLTIAVEDISYGRELKTVMVGFAGTKIGTAALPVDLGRSFGWYDYRIRVDGAPECEWRYCGRIETGRESFSDPLMGRTKV